MKNTNRTAIILGATGLVGGLLLHRLLNDDHYTLVKVFTRRSLGFTHAKLQEHVGNLLELEQFADHFTGDVVFCCIGTTKAKTHDQTVYKAIDYGIPLAAAQLAKQNHVPCFMVISALGANAHSPFFYNKIKGQMEQAVLEQKCNETYILRPSLIVGARKETRLGERLGACVMKCIEPILVGRLKKYRAVNAQAIAEVLFILSIEPSLKEGASPIIESDEIQYLARKKH